MVCGNPVRGGGESVERHLYAFITDARKPI
jgi:hypothetical protein